MKKKNYIFHLLTSTICSFLIMSFFETAFADENSLLQIFLQSEDVTIVESAYRDIVKNKNKYRNEILQELNLASDNPNEMSDRLLYIASYVRDQRYIEPIANMVKNTEYVYYSCIYDCPIVFSLTIFSEFSPYSLPSDLNGDNLAVHDLNSAINVITKLKIKDEKASDYVNGPRVDAYFDKAESYSTEDIINCARSENAGDIPRHVAAFILRYRLVDIKYLADLYWLAITEPANDASYEFRNSIYWAIYKTEKNKLRVLKTGT